jgi:hypothetical protein
MPIRRGSGRAVDRTHLRARVGRNRRRVEGRVFDGVAHAEDIIVTHRLDVEQRAAVVEMELAMPAIVNRVAEVHELRRRPDVELQALENRWDVDTFIVQRPLHASGVDRAGAGPLLDGDLHHLLAPKLLDAPRHAGAIDHLPDQQQLG